MSVTISTCHQINRSPSNSSPSKQLYSFSKQKRFPNPHSNCKTFSYNLKRSFIKSDFKNFTKTSFGVQRPELFYSKELL